MALFAVIDRRSRSRRTERKSSPKLSYNDESFRSFDCETVPTTNTNTTTTTKSASSSSLETVSTWSAKSSSCSSSSSTRHHHNHHHHHHHHRRTFPVIVISPSYRFYPPTKRTAASGAKRCKECPKVRTSPTGWSSHSSSSTSLTPVSISTQPTFTPTRQRSSRRASKRKGHSRRGERKSSSRSSKQSPITSKEDTGDARRKLSISSSGIEMDEHSEEHMCKGFETHIHAFCTLILFLHAARI